MIVGSCRSGLLARRASLAAQKSQLAAAGAQEFFFDKAGLAGGRPELERAISSLGKGDVLVVTRPYRVARSTRGVLALIDRLGRKGAGLRILGTPVDTSTTTGRMILGSAPVWSLGMSPLRAVFQDLALRRLHASR
jgi:DNA invertase Pin-like site-specific DNA recombinase